MGERIWSICALQQRRLRFMCAFVRGGPRKKKRCLTKSWRRCLFGNTCYCPLVQCAPTPQTTTSVSEPHTAREMAPRADQRTGQAAFTDGRKRKAPSDGGRDPPRHTTKSKQACGADRGRLKDGKPGSTSIARGSGKPGPKAKCVRFAGDGKCQAKQNAKGKSAIDDIFSGVKRLKEEQAEEEAERWVFGTPGNNRVTAVSAQPS